jgi:hypothetical protein
LQTIQRDKHCSKTYRKIIIWVPSISFDSIQQVGCTNMINKEHTYNIHCMYVLNFLLAIIMIAPFVSLLVVSHSMSFLFANMILGYDFYKFVFELFSTNSPQKQGFWIKFTRYRMLLNNDMFKKNLMCYLSSCYLMLNPFWDTSQWSNIRKLGEKLLSPCFCN